MSDRLMAYPDVVVIDRKAGATNGTTNVVYAGIPGTNPPILWERIVGSPWIRVPIRPPRIRFSRSGDPAQDGMFTMTLKPGQVYQVAMYYDTDPTDPNVKDPNTANKKERSPDQLITVYARLKDPERTDLLTSEDQNIGGTFFQKVALTRMPTLFLLEVDMIPPYLDADGVPQFVAPKAIALDLPGNTHDRLAEPLFPGNDYFFLMRLIDEDGNWQVVSGKFRTKQRKVTINFQELHIINDGAPGDTTAEFRIWVVEGGMTVKEYFFGDVENFDISDRPSPGEEHHEHIPLKRMLEPFLLGPNDVTETTNDVAILTRGLCHHNVGSDDWTMNFYGDPDNPRKFAYQHDTFPFPTGINEKISNFPFIVRTWYHLADVEFEYSVTSHFTVEYV